MRKLIPYLVVFTLFISSNLAVNAQNYRFQVGGGLGVSNQLGDIGGKFLPRRNFVNDLRFNYTGLTGNIGAKYALTPRILAGLGVAYGRISGEDSLSTNVGRNLRNLSFRNNILEISTTVDLQLYEAFNVARGGNVRTDFAFYLTLGVGYFMHNPQAKIDGDFANPNTGEVFTYSGWQDLQPLKTEVQAVPYKLNGLSTILGLGFDFTMNKIHRVGFQLGVRTTNTDYLDDISTNYPNPAVFGNDREGTLAYHLSSRRGEIDPNYEYPKPGSVRGNPKYDDSYMFATINYAYVFRGKGGKYKRRFNSGFVKRGRKSTLTQFFAF